MWKKKSKSFTLLEGLIALILSSCLLTVILGALRIFTLFYSSDKVHHELDLFNCYHFLKRKFHAVPATIHPQDNKYFFPCFLSTKEGSLLFSFNNEVQKNPALSSSILASLELNEAKDLSFVIWPSPTLNSDKPSSESVHLLSNVDSISYSFYHPKSNCWIESWDSNNRFPPLILSIKIEFENQKQTKMDFHFSQIEQRVRVDLDA